jgi:hypothetical protein
MASGRAAPSPPASAARSALRGPSSALGTASRPAAR